MKGIETMKSERQAAILDLIMTKEIGTQEDLLAELRLAGMDVTQATVSRDIREMKLTKVEVGGKLRYVTYRKTEQDLTEKYARIFRDGFLSMDRVRT